MTTLIEVPATLAVDPPAAERPRTTMAAMRLSFAWFGVRKALSDEQNSRAADAFGAEGQFLSAGKKLLDTLDPAFKAVRLAEAAFLDELSKLVEHLTERLSGTDDGKPKVFRDSAVENLTGFFERFRQFHPRPAGRPFRHRDRRGRDWTAGGAAAGGDRHAQGRGDKTGDRFAGSCDHSRDRH